MKGKDKEIIISHPLDKLWMLPKFPTGFELMTFGESSMNQTFTSSKKKERAMSYVFFLRPKKIFLWEIALSFLSKGLRLVIG